MLLKKYVNLPGLSVGQVVIESGLASSISLSKTMFGMWKTKW